MSGDEQLVGAVDEDSGDDPESRPEPRRDADIPQRSADVPHRNVPDGDADEDDEEDRSSSSEVTSEQPSSAVSEVTETAPRPGTGSSVETPSIGDESAGQSSFESEPSKASSTQPGEKPSSPSSPATPPKSGPTVENTNSAEKTPFETVESFDIDPLPDDLETEFAYIHDRDGTHDSRRLIGFHVLPHTEDALKEAHREAEKRFGDVDEADLREATVMCGLSNLSEVMQRLYDWGYRPD